MTTYHQAPHPVAGEPRDVLPAAPEWMDSAPCASTDPYVFFPGQGESSDPAKRVCAECPLRLPCLKYALEEGIKEGIWGGLTAEDRRKLKRGKVA